MEVFQADYDSLVSRSCFCETLQTQYILYRYLNSFSLLFQGPPKVASNEPKNFLTKRSKEFQLPESKSIPKYNLYL